MKMTKIEVYNCSSSTNKTHIDNVQKAGGSESLNINTLADTLTRDGFVTTADQEGVMMSITKIDNEEVKDD